MDRLNLRFCFISLICFLPFGFSSGSDSARQIAAENLDSLAAQYRGSTARLTSPEFERRREILRQFQRRGYVTVLSDVIAQDGLSALLAWTKTTTHIRYYLPHEPIILTFPIVQSGPPDSQNPWHTTSAPSPPLQIPLYLDWKFPDDPWQRK